MRFFSIVVYRRLRTYRHGTLSIQFIFYFAPAFYLPRHQRTAEIKYRFLYFLDIRKKKVSLCAPAFTTLPHSHRCLSCPKGYFSREDEKEGTQQQQ